MAAVPIERIGRDDERHLRERLASRRPVVVEGMAEGWPAASWTPASVCEAYGDLPVTVARTVKGRLDCDLERGLTYERMTIREAASDWLAGVDNGRYVVTTVPEPMLRDLPVPAVCRGAPWLRQKMWFGPGGIVTPTHRGAPENLFAQLTGKKRFVMWPASQTPQMHRYSLLSKLPNFAPVDPDAPDDPRYPRFREATPFVAELAPGDVLYIPRLWWHHVTTPVMSIGVNFWWSHGVAAGLSIAADLFKRLRRLSV